MIETHGHGNIHLGRALIAERYKYVYFEEESDEFYDLENDPFEISNLIQSPQHLPKIHQLKKKLQSFRSHINDNITLAMIGESELKEIE